MTVILPRELTANGDLSLAGRVVAADPAGGFEPGEQACSIAFETLDNEKSRALRSLLRAPRAGKRVPGSAHRPARHPRPGRPPPRAGRAGEVRGTTRPRRAPVQRLPLRARASGAALPRQRLLATRAGRRRRRRAHPDRARPLERRHARGALRQPERRRRAQARHLRSGRAPSPGDSRGGVARRRRRRLRAALRERRAQDRRRALRVDDAASELQRLDTAAPRRR